MTLAIATDCDELMKLITVLLIVSEKACISADKEHELNKLNTTDTYKIFKI